MVMLSVGILALQKDSKFAGFYNSGKFNKMTAWEYVYEDASDIVGPHARSSPPSSTT